MSFYFDASFSCFFNALIREFQIWEFVENTSDVISRSSENDNESRQITAQEESGERLQGNFLIVDEVSGETLKIPCKRYSVSGRHALLSPCVLLGKESEVGGGEQTLNVNEATRWVLNSSRLKTEANAQQVQDLCERVQSSERNFQEALAYREDDLNDIFQHDLDFAEGESALLIGHSIHPCPKARDNFTADDSRQYSPEFRSEFALNWCRIEKSQLFVRAASDTALEKVGVDFSTVDSQVSAWQSDLSEGQVLIPCHPFQQRVWEKNHWFQDLSDTGVLQFLGEGSLPWRATSSVRAVYCRQAPWMLKFSLSVKLTNSLRHLHPQELARGAELCRVLQTTKAQEFFKTYPNFTILKEPLGAAILGPDNKPLSETVFLLRQNEFRNADADNHETLATLLQDDPRDGISRLAKRLQAGGLPEAAALDWFRRYLDVVVKPLLAAQADYGLLFGAHQQNIVLKTDGVWPVALKFRDCQGTGYSTLAKSLYAEQLPNFAEDSENLISDDMAVRLFSYYLFVNATFNVISSLANADLISEQRLLKHLARFLKQIKQMGVRDSRCIDYLLNCKELSAKSNFGCSIRRLNESTQEDILSLYHPYPNPLISMEMQ